MQSAQTVGQSDNKAAAVAVAQAQSIAANAGMSIPAGQCSPNPLLGAGGSPNKLADDVRHKLWEEFARNRPGRVVTAAHKPFKQLAQVIWGQFQARELTWIPWKRLVSQHEWDTAKKRTGRSKERYFFTIVSEMHGPSDVMEIDGPTSPFRVIIQGSGPQGILLGTCGPVAFQECHDTHKLRILGYYMNKILESAGMRPPAEAEAADEIMMEVIPNVMQQQEMSSLAIYSGTASCRWCSSCTS
ncbi:unnamed protein product [Polarella glacialis]|uniref:Uncharacterized protein n=1 Tax=Polarella glacialis TaxID=89957 RepID=A0A813CZA2_POLGL|nr:unnamed protein product [Polarella glacialis]